MEKPKNCYNILLGCTGSVASVKIPNIISELISTSETRDGVQIRLIGTEHSFYFFDMKSLPGVVEVFRDEDEWNTWKSMGDPVLHIELRRWADILIIAPLDANTLAKIACGLCDNLLTCVVRAWDPAIKPLLFCPGMNTLMWEHPITKEHVNKLKNYGYTEIPPITKKLACGDTGIGAMAEVRDIVNVIWSTLLKA